MIYFILGIFIGIGLSLIAVIVGKKITVAINDSIHTIQPIKNSFIQQKAEIIKKEDVIEEFLNE